MGQQSRRINCAGSENLHALLSGDSGRLGDDGVYEGEQGLKNVMTMTTISMQTRRTSHCATPHAHRMTCTYGTHKQMHAHVSMLPNT